jgi:hypothetical protein
MCSRDRAREPGRRRRRRARIRPGGIPERLWNRQTDTGHRGRFRSADYFLEAFAAAGGKAERAEVRDLTWVFPSETSAGEFSRELFGLRPDTPGEAILAELRRLGLAEKGGEVRLPWRMVFVSAAR